MSEENVMKRHGSNHLTYDLF